MVKIERWIKKAKYVSSSLWSPATAAVWCTHTKRLSLASIFPCSNIFMEAKNYFLLLSVKRAIFISGIQMTSCYSSAISEVGLRKITISVWNNWLNKLKVSKGKNQKMALLCEIVNVSTRVNLSRHQFSFWTPFFLWGRRKEKRFFNKNKSCNRNFHF